MRTSPIVTLTNSVLGRYFFKDSDPDLTAGHFIHFPALQVMELDAAHLGLGSIVVNGRNTEGAERILFSASSGGKIGQFKLMNIPTGHSGERD